MSLEQYQLKMPGRVYSGKNSLLEIAEIAGGHHRAALFTDRSIYEAGLTQRAEKLLQQAGVLVERIDDLPSEPTCDEAQAVVERFERTGADLIVAVGGGSVMDIAKLASIADGEGCTVRDMLEDPFAGKKRVPVLMIPTTAGTGSEATANSIVAVPERELKVGIVNPEMMADYVILDGEMIRNLPPRIAAATGLDALCHAIECYTSNKANPFSDLFAMEAMKLIFANLEKACEDADALEEKNNMLLAAFYGGVAIASSGTTAVHALSYPLGGKYHIAHGISNAIMLLPVMRFNKEACLREFAEIYDALGSVGLTENSALTEEQKADWLLERMERMIERLHIPTALTAFGVDKKDLDALVEAGMDVQRLLGNNKRTVTAEDARRLYLEVL